MNFKKGTILAIIVIAIIVIIGIIFLTKDNNTNNKKNITNTTKSTTQSNIEHEKERRNYTQVLKVYNAAEYIDTSTIEDFEKEYKVRVEYSEFESNEDMYDDVSANPNNYDVLVPSDYTIDRLIKEDRLAKIDKTKLTNISNVAEEYLAPAYDPNNDYVIPYMTGTLGILYNTKEVSNPIDSWTALFDSKYKGKILIQ